MIDSYKTIKSSSEGEYKEKGSKFLAFAFPVNSEEEVKEKLEELRKSYYDARHHCYAYILNPEANQYRANDDGEPSHSAGDPILGQIRSLELTNVLVVVVRYFGGTKLGVGGLINAYKTAAEEALKKGQIIEERVRVEFLIKYPYEATNEVMRLTAEFDISILEQEYTTSCSLKGAVIISQKEVLEDKISLLQDLGNDISIDFF